VPDITIQSRRYAQAVFEIASSSLHIDSWHQDLQKLAALAEMDDFAFVMENPGIDLEAKVKLLDSQIKTREPLAINLAHILIKRGKFRLIKSIFEAFQILEDDAKGIQKAEVITASAMDAAEKQKVMNYLSAIQNKKIILTEKVDPAIIGGLIARVGGKIIDGSTRSQLEALKNRLIEAGR
jgi:F-type H+-transporting ATPase subunit delta